MMFKTFMVLFSGSVMSKPCATSSNFTHVKCRGGMYPRSSVVRYPVPDGKVSWTVAYEEYIPAFYTSPSVKGKPWADPEIDHPKFSPIWNSVDGKVNRMSYMGEYEIRDNVPLNPIGRTGVTGRGVLGRWGPNHAADPVVTRWKLENNKSALDGKSKKRILQFVAVKRSDTGEWALPGGMVDPGEKVTNAAIREFQEEATNSLAKNEAQRKEWSNKFSLFFSQGNMIYRGYVDDPRNTDNAWMETAAYNFHDETGATVGALNLSAGDDAVGVMWVDYNADINLYASHHSIVKAVAKNHNAHDSVE